MIYHKTFGNDPDRDWVVLVHGAGGSSSIWFKQLKEFTQYFNVLLVDLRGHGKSSDFFEKYLRNHYTFKEVSQDVVEVLDHLKIEKAHFVGISLGCIIIREIAELIPHRCLSLVLGGAILKINLRSKFLMWVADVIKQIVPFIWVYKLYAFILMPRKRHQESRSLFVQEARRLANKEFLRWFKLTAEVNPLLRYFSEKELKIPTLYLMGEEDHMFLPQVKRQIQNHSFSVLKIFPRCGHVVNVEKPEWFNQYAISFMKNPFLRAFTLPKISFHA
jgi:pimeloyl-ACP methyl ester carboxylesterase